MRMARARATRMQRLLPCGISRPPARAGAASQVRPRVILVFPQADDGDVLSCMSACIRYHVCDSGALLGRLQRDCMGLGVGLLSGPPFARMCGACLPGSPGLIVATQRLC